MFTRTINRDDEFDGFGVGDGAPAAMSAQFKDFPVFTRLGPETAFSRREPAGHFVRERIGRIGRRTPVKYRQAVASIGSSP